jgi:peptide/nickel transport system substrate-binding protein
MRGSRMKVGAPLTLLACLFVICLGWGITGAFAASTSPAPQSGTLDLRIGWTVQPDNLNPFIGWADATYEVWALNYSFLFGFGTNNKPTLDLAAEFPTQANGGISADGLTYTIHIKPNLKWSDGTPLTAADVAFTYNYIVDNAMANYTYMMVGIKRTVAVDATTMKIICTRPKADLEYMWVPILPQHVWEQVPPAAAEADYQVTYPLVGSGPFQVVQFKRNDFVHLTRNPYYYGKKAAVSDIFFQMYMSADAMTVDLQATNIDAAWGIPTAQFAGLKSASGISPVPYILMNWDYLSFNCYTGKSLGNPVLKDWKFRNALNWAVDRERLSQTAFNGDATAGTTIAPPGTWHDPDYHWQPPADQVYTFDLAKADLLLDQAGYPRGAGGLRQYQGQPITLRLWATTDSVPEQTEAGLIASWFKQLGLKIQYSTIDQGALENRIWFYQGDTFVPNFDMYVWSWDGYNDPGQTLSTMTTSQIENSNEPAWSNAQFDRLNTQQFAALDPEKRKQLIWQMQQIMYEQTPWIVTTYPDHLEAFNNDKWTGWTRVTNEQGPVFFAGGNVESYLNLMPKSGAAKKGATGVWLALGVLAGIIVIALVAMMIMRRRGRVEEM